MEDFKQMQRCIIFLKLDSHKYFKQNYFMKILTTEDIIQSLSQKTQPHFSSYKAMFSSWHGGIIVNPSFMQVPVDDHLVHRGDGVFEAIKSINGKIFLFDEHLARLQKSADVIALKLPNEISEIKKIILETLKVANIASSLIRVFVSRGPGGFTTNPYESVGSQLYVIITEFKAVLEEKYQTGVKAALSQIPIKESWLATTKTCNYLPNVMMKKEAIDKKVDFTINQNAEGFLGESSTENFAIIAKDGSFVHPPFNEILKGTTLVLTSQFAAQLGLITQIKKIKLQDIKEAKEVFMIGTTLDVLPVTQFENFLIAGGKVGPWAKKLRAELQKSL